jgi:hypothetical protein
MVYDFEVGGGVAGSLDSGQLSTSQDMSATTKPPVNEMRAIMKSVEKYCARKLPWICVIGIFGSNPTSIRLVVPETTTSKPLGGSEI